MHIVTELRTRITLRVSPGAARSAVVARHGDGWKVRVAAPPAEGRANAALERLLALALGLRRSQIRIVAGASGREKIVELSGLDAAETDALMAAAADGAVAA